MSRYHYHSGSASDLKGLVGAGRVAFEFEMAHGSGKRRLAVAVEPALILRLADAIRACGGDAGNEIGHVVWHLQNERPIPCSTCVSYSPPDIAGSEGVYSVHVEPVDEEQK